MENITAALTYHDRTKHRPQRYAASLGYMDWATQPDPFRRYEGAPLIALAHTEITPPYHLLFGPEPLPAAPVCFESISQLLRYSLGLAAWKSAGGSTWALRCNASSGNLHPTECYLLTPPVSGIADKAVLSHYAPREHALEMLHTYEGEPLPQGTILIALSSLIWREMWKYGERCWPYCQLDAGHAAQSLKTAAAMLGWECELLSVETDEIGRLCGLDQLERFDEHERESPDLLLRIGQSAPFAFPDTPALPCRANRLSPSHHAWPAVEAIDTAARGIYPASAPILRPRRLPLPSRSAGEIILKRRSAQMMDGTGISEAVFRQILDASLYCRNAPDITFAIFVHNVAEIEKGLYIYVRNHEERETLRAAMDPEFDWNDCGEGLYLLRSLDYRSTAQRISCNQEIAKEGAFSFGMLCRFSPVLEEKGAIGYKNLYHQCGMIGQTLYLEATSLGLSATGIGCFLDDEFHALLGLRDQRYQSLYHFTIGRAIVDTRITTLPPY
ncbi:MAG: SagB/ThcOx family dehydrogenase [Campylobacterales bacterium]|nr:SagB/ThcOx family dehydrogenase [Campylobacterales bacterium]